MIEFIQQQGALYTVGFSFIFVVVIWLLNKLQRTLPSPVNKLIVRWFRLILVGFFVALLLKISLLSYVQFWRLLVMGILGWVFVDSAYLWVYILAWDKSELPLFPTIKEVDKIDWPANRRFFMIKDWIRENNFEQISSMQYVYEDEVLQNLIVYESPDKLIRLQVVIVTDVSGVILDQVAFVSETEKGERIITDNVYMPFGGIYPDGWIVERFPSVRSIQLIAKHHADTLQKKAGVCCVKFDSNVKDWIEAFQNELEEINIDAGLLNKRMDRSNFGKMSGEGRYRLWKEMLVLNYFGKAIFGK